MLFLVFTLSVAGLGNIAISAVVISWIRNHNALPVWANQTNRDGSYGGKR